MVLITSAEQTLDGQDSEGCRGWRSPYGGAVVTLLVHRPLGVWEQPRLVCLKSQQLQSIKNASDIFLLFC